MYSVDKGNYKKFLTAFPRQIMESKQIFSKNNKKKDKDPLNSIFFLGMGGSAIAGDMIREILYDQLPVPMQVVRDYEMPVSCSDQSLVIAVSYSGNTEETLSAVKQAAARNARIVAITCGGELSKLAKKHHWQLMKIPGGYPPRQAIGYLLLIAYQIVISAYGKIMSNNDFHLLHSFAESMVRRSDEASADRKVFTKDLAVRIKGKIPIIYSSTPFLAATARRWKNQFQENSKSMAFFNVVPEMNHNEIVGWEMSGRSLENYIVLFLESAESSERISQRIKLTKNIIQDRGTEVFEIYTEGNNRLAQIISLIIRGDWISYYLALLYGNDPLKIVNIDYLKAELKKYS